MRFNASDKLFFADSFQFLSSSLNSLIKSFRKNNFKYLSEKRDGKVFDLVKEKRYDLCDDMSDFKNLIEKLSSKEKLHNSLADQKISNKIYKYALQV